MIWDINKTYPLYTLTAHTGDVRALVLMGNQYLASGAQDMTVKLWSLSSYSVVASWQASTTWVLSLAFDPTLSVLAIGDDANLVKVVSSDLWSNLNSSTSSGTQISVKQFFI